MHEELRARLSAIAASYLADARGCHRMDHTRRVVVNARRLAAHFPEIDADVLEAAAWLHDIGRAREAESGRSHAHISAELSVEILPELGFSAARTQLACTAIADHRFSEGRAPASREGQLLQDADRLDALGAIGIARTFAESRERELFHPEDPFAARREPDDEVYALDHFFVKLLQLPATMHTAPARALARRRVRYLRGFLRELADELGDS